VTRSRLVWSCLALMLASAVAAMALGCGGSPSQPGPINQPPPPPSNSPPTIDSIVASASRTEVDTDVTVTATVRDAETPVSQLSFAWKADAGTFTGTGPTVTWRVPKGVATPADYTIRLTVTETYSNGQNVVNGTSAAIRVHDSPKEIGDIGTHFLKMFGDSSISTNACVIDFNDNVCSFGRDAEKTDIDYNRKHYLILNYELGPPRVNYTAGANRAEVFIRSSFTSRIINCSDWPNPSCVLNATESATFDGYMPMVYDKGRWWICESHALTVKGVSPLMERFFGRMQPR
jgi:hypothetical protein